MAWTAPRTWVAEEVVTAALLNTHLRDNLLALSTHAHSGSAGDGSQTLGNLVKDTFTDASAPSAPGSGLTMIYAVSSKMHQRAGVSGSDTAFVVASDLHAEDHASRHQPSGADTMAVDAVAGTGSLRTLGSGSTQAAAGNHTHTLTEGESAVTAGAGSISSAPAVGSGATVNSDATISPSGQERVVGFAVSSCTGASTSDTQKLFIDGTEIATQALSTSVLAQQFVLKGSRTVASGSRIIRNQHIDDSNGHGAVQGAYGMGIKV